MRFFTLLLVCIVAMGITQANAQPAKWKSSKYSTIVSYNVENLFDTIDSPHKDDKEFTPQGDKQWNSERYHSKIKNIAYVLSTINTHELPELIGLVEVENKSVINDLINDPQLKAGKYNYEITDGPDPRGINCALLYRTDAFHYLTHQHVKVTYPFANDVETRGILYVKGLVNKDTVHVFVNHWKSRLGGQDDTEEKRMQSAKILKNVVDSICHKNNNAAIVIMGDFNDEPGNKSIYEELGAGKVSDKKALTNLMYEYYSAGKGTYYFRGDYNLLDNLIVSTQNMSALKGFRPFEDQGYIFMPDTICFVNKNGDKSPARTYVGNKYYNGYSDHFPVYMYFYEK